MTLEQNIQVKIAMSKDKLRILINIFAESLRFGSRDKIALPNPYPGSKVWLSAYSLDN